MALSRRTLLLSSAAAGATGAVTTWPLAASAAPYRGPLRTDPFTLGVASGDPEPDGFVLWTRLAQTPLAEDGLGGMPSRGIAVEWELSLDERFRRLMRRGAAMARPESAHTVHLELHDLPPGREFFYRFRAEKFVSPVGRTRTAPAPDSTPARLRFVNAGCQHYEHGFFTAWRHIAGEEELDLVLHYGDYIYEVRGAQPGQPGWGPAVRRHEGEETYTLEDYRRRYAQYRMDPDLAAAHAAHPFLVSFDDHEVDNDWAGLVSEEDGASRRFPVHVPPEVFALRLQAAFQAWWEHMPLRRSALPRGPAILAHRRIGWGRLADIHMLDTRQHRDDQPCGDGVVRPCEAVARPDAQMLGAAQERWLLDGMGASRATWQVLAQQVMLMRREFPEGRLGMDKWDGYPAARARLLRGIQDRGIGGAVVLTGDVHNAWAGEVRLDPLDERSPVVATEFVATSITSGGDGGEANPTTAEMRRRNPHIHFFNNRRGYCLHEATAERMEVTFRALPIVTRPGAPREDRGRFVVEAGRPGILPG
jgi:alkaline phosphatase D